MENARLKNMFKLSGRITVYVPSTTDINIEIDNTEYVKKTSALLSECFGGATSTSAIGYWLSDTAGLVQEKTVLVFGFCNETQLSEHLDKVIDLCETMKTELKQEAIALEINGELYFI